MKKLNKILFLSLILVSTSFSQLNFDTVSNLQVGMGIFYKKYIEYSKPWNIYVLEIDMNVPYNSIETIKAQDRLAGYEKTSAMARRRSFPGHIAVGAINGDFYGGTGIPINIQIRDGQLLRRPSVQSTVGFSDNKKPMLARVNFSASVKKGNSATVINGVNENRGTNQLILFNKFNGTNTGTNIYGTEVAVKSVSQWYANDTVICVVTNKVTGTGGMALNDSTSVLSGNGTAATWLNSLAVGDTVKIFMGLSPGVAKLKELIGGFPKIVYNGADYVDQGYLEEGGPSHTYERHPRTAVGFSQDSSKIYFIAVDGRSAQSIGMTLHELADFMQRIGVYQGINFDGGGSTTMFVRDSVMNVTSDGVERTVANAMAVFTSSPQGSLDRIRISPGSYRLYHGESVSFSTYGFDQYYNPVPLTQGTPVYSVTPGIGTLTGNTFTAGNNPDTGYVYVNYQGFRDSALIVVKGITRIQLSPRYSVTDSTRILEVKAQAWDMDGTPRNLEANLYTWSVSDPTVGTIDSTGKFKGRDNGFVTVFADHRGNKDSVLISVEIGEGIRLIDGMDDLQAWTVDYLLMDTTGTNLSIAIDTFTTAPGSFKLNYKFTYETGVFNYIYLKTDKQIYGVPDSIHVDVKADGPQHHVTWLVTDENDELFRITMPQYITSVIFQETKTPVNRAVPGGTTGTLYFPLKLKEIQIRMGSSRVPGQVYSGTIYMDNLRVSYPTEAPVSVKDMEMPSGFGLWGNFPNPFNPETTISYSLDKAGNTLLDIYDITGAKIESLVNAFQSPGKYHATWKGNKYTSGVYFAVLNREGDIRVHKMVLLK
ncbi:MAG: phosphodiester glycosidase family protein [Ignavibacteria bacterium]|nr:phosphodiester glycosidase family protein [Ignavibacteria bacterium]